MIKAKPRLLSGAVLRGKGREPRPSVKSMATFGPNGPKQIS